MTGFYYLQANEKKNKIERAYPFQSVVERVTESGMWKNDKEVKIVTQPWTGPWGNNKEHKL